MKTIKKLSILIAIFCILSCSNDDYSNEDETKATVKDIYVCGMEIRSNGGKYIATFWKNGVVTSLTDGSKNAIANDIAVVGNDVYVAGYEENYEGLEVAKVWKNGTPTILDASPGSANLIVVNGIDVYVKGTVNKNGKYKAKIWKNALELFAAEGAIRGIAVNNTDVYAVGSENGVPQDLSTALNSYANALFITTN
ncbi:hypothetical protein [Flavobacterium sp.]|uniref:hypothetical protein n=1 Tax=Flavobacterium sp. TaxID=239 RepID=UPI00326585FB